MLKIRMKGWKVWALLPLLVIAIPALWYLTIGWEQIPDDVPATQQIYQQEFSSAAHKLSRHYNNPERSSRCRH